MFMDGLQVLVRKIEACKPEFLAQLKAFSCAIPIGMV